MKQLLLTCAFALMTLGLTAQDTLWMADFSDGLTTWDVNTISCGDNTGEMLGKYSLTSIDVSGTIITPSPNEIHEFNLINANEYAVKHTDGMGEEATVYGRYTIENDIFQSNIDGSMVVADGLAFDESSNNGIVNWTTLINVSPDLLPITLQLAGVGDPTITFTNGGSNLNLSYSGGLVQLYFERTSSCGDNWVWSPNGNFGFNLFGASVGDVINSETRTNGSVQMNPLYQSSLGMAGYSPGNPPYPEYNSEIISPAIDISAADRPIEVQFTQAIRFLNLGAGAPENESGTGLRNSFSISTDGGATWSPAIDANPGLAVNADPLLNANTRPIPIAYVGDATEIMIKFTFATDFYYWALDDIIIRERGGAEMQANSNFFAIAPSAITPISQVEPFGFLADIQNNGGVAGENVQLSVTVNNDTEGTELFASTLDYGTIVPDSLAENQPIPGEIDETLLTVGNYSGQYVITHDMEDEDPSNDILDFEFSVSDTLFAKEFGATRQVTPAGDNSYYFGNAFYVPNGDGLYARHLSFAVRNADEIAAAGNAGAVTVYLYQWAGDVNDDGLMNADEYGGSQIAINGYEFTGDEAADEIITIPFDLDGAAIELFDGFHYVAVIQYLSTGDEDQMAMSASDDFDYGAMTLRSELMEMGRYAPVLFVGSDVNPDFFASSFNGRSRIMPLVRMSIGDNPDLSGPAFIIDDVNDVLSDRNTMEIYPNPASTHFTLKLEMEEMVDNAVVQLFTTSGQMIWERTYPNLVQATFDYDVNTLPAGTYFVRLKTEKGSKTQQVIVK